MTGKASRAIRLLRIAMVLTAVAVPTVSLIPLGSLWLWQNGYLLYWLIGALAVSAISFGIQAWLVRAFDERAPLETLDKGTVGPNEPAPDATWAPRERTAWAEVERLAQGVDPAQLTSRDAVLDLGMRTIETVARSIHPADKDPLWRFTVPEALSLVERVARDLKPFVVDNIPLGDQLTIAQVLGIYRWRGVVQLAERAYDLWRIVRLLNPIAAATSEARERLTGRLYAGARDELARRLTQGFVKEIGRAAIDLYGGRLRQVAEPAAALAGTTDLAPNQQTLRILVAGQISAGKSSLLNALTLDVRAAVDVLPATESYAEYVLSRENLPPVVLVDSPGLRLAPRALQELVERAADCDLMIWVVAANRADRDVDQQALSAIRVHFAAHSDRLPSPILVVVTHIDRLRPLKEWEPPYDMANTGNPKIASILAAIAEISRDLKVGKDHIVPVSLLIPDAGYNIEQVWVKIVELVPEAQRARLVRQLRQSMPGWKWTTLWSQISGATRAATRILTKPDER